MPLTVFPLLSSGGNLTNATNQTYLRQGQVGELANQYMTAKHQRVGAISTRTRMCRAPTS